MSASAEITNARATAIEQRFTGPVVLAALASVPATFLTLLDGWAAAAGSVLNAASLVVFTAEAVVLLALAEDRRAWIRRHRFLLLVTVATIPAVLFALGPVQVLRLLRAAGALRILRVRRILKAATTLRARAGLDGPLARVATVVIAGAAAAFVAVVLADPTSTSRQVLDGTMTRYGVVPVLLAGALVAGATYVVARARRRADR
jgi:CsoR family transcriptional regulator, copper-sensing transcriptional repressor